MHDTLRTSHSAIRTSSAIQLSLPLFPAPSFEEIVELDQVRGLSIVLNRRMRSGWRVSETSFTGRRQLMVPASYADAPEEMKRAIIAWALLPLRTRRGSRNHAARKELERRVWEHLKSLGKAPRRESRLDPARFEGQVRGTRYDLRAVFDDLNARHFDGRLSSLVRWGARGSLTSYHTMRHDRTGNAHNTITIAGVYDHPKVPEFALRAVMYHEMLHIALPPQKKNGRRSIHGAEFRRAERAYPDYERWREWEHRELGRLAQGMRREGRR